MHYFPIFFQKFNKPCVNFVPRLDDKHNCWKFWENFRKLWKSSFRKLRKMHYFSIYFKIFNITCVIFCTFGQKTQNGGKCWENFESFWWKFKRKMEFLFYLAKFGTKNRAFWNNTIFLQQFFRFRDGDFPLSPWLGPWYLARHN